jgi:hypothetical protein
MRFLNLANSICRIIVTISGIPTAKACEDPERSSVMAACTSAGVFGRDTVCVRDGRTVD